MSQARILTDREFRKVLLYIAAHKHSPRNKCLLYMSHLAGLRAKEIADLSIKDVLAEDGTIKDDKRTKHLVVSSQGHRYINFLAKAIKKAAVSSLN